MVKSISWTDREADYGEEAEGESEEIQEGKTRCPGAQEEGDEEGDASEEENRGKEAGAKARARSDSSDANLRKFRRQDRRSIDTTAGSNARRAAPIVRQLNRLPRRRRVLHGWYFDADRCQCLDPYGMRVSSASDTANHQKRLLLNQKDRLAAVSPKSDQVF